MCFCFTSNKNVTFPMKNRETQNGLLIFIGKERHIPKQNHGNRRGFRRKKLQQQQRQTLEIVEDFACEAKFHHFLSFSSFFPFFRFFSFIHVVHSFSFFHFLHFYFLSFSFFVFVGCSKSDFFLGLNFVTISLDNSNVKNQFWGPSRVLPLWARFSFFFLLFFSRFLSFFLLLIFHFSHFSKEKFHLFFFLVFLSNMFHCWHQYQSLTVSSVVGPP